jgi:bifunctional oligoribonuclease and PAP phosphatase NrnA
MLTSREQILEQVKKAQSILITFSSHWNGDNLGSALALYLSLKKLGKKVDVASSKFEGSLAVDGKVKPLSFLPGFSEIKRTIRDLNKFVISLSTDKTKIRGVKYRLENDCLKFIVSAKRGNFSPADVKIESEGGKYDLIITLDTPDLDSLGPIFAENTQFFYETPVINIDHHAGNDEYGSINLVQINSVSTSEIVLSLLENFSDFKIDGDVATCLLTGIISKTKNFKTANITPDTLAATSSLISKEARREEIVNRLYRSRDLSSLKLWGLMLSRLSSVAGNSIIWSAVTANDFLKTGAGKNDLAGLVDELAANIPEAKAVVVFYDEASKDGTTGVNFLIHTPKNINLLDLVKEYHPHGDERTVEAATGKKLEEAKTEVIGLLERKIGQYGL